jgi:hypothetical protein
MNVVLIWDFPTRIFHWAFAGSLAAALFRNHDARSATVRLPVIGASIQLGENESAENEHAHKERREGHHDDD